jgi:hypothetical protein
MPTEQAYRGDRQKKKTRSQSTITIRPRDAHRAGLGGRTQRNHNYDLQLGFKRSTIIFSRKTRENPRALTISKKPSTKIRYIAQILKSFEKIFPMNRTRGLEGWRQDVHLYIRTKNMETA